MRLGIGNTTALTPTIVKGLQMGKNLRKKNLHRYGDEQGIKFTKALGFYKKEILF